LSAIAAVPASVGAQQAAGAGQSVNDYLCTFAGKCGETDAEDTPTRAAPTTKGFRLAAPTGPTQQAPSTKGFRLAAPQARQAAPETKGFRLAAPRQAAPTAQRGVRPVQLASRSTAARPRPVAAGARADLMLAFGYNSDRLTDVAQGKARTFAQALMMPELRDKRFMIEGHTDSRGARDLNVDLSRRRAQSVADFLVAQGVDRSRVEVRGLGPDKPLPGRSAAAVSNRRVEAVLLS